MTKPTPRTDAARKQSGGAGRFVVLCEELESDLATANETIDILRRENGMQHTMLVAANERLERLRKLANDIPQDWMEQPSVAGTGDYDQGLMCGVEDRGYQKDGYSAMRYGYDRALERVAEAIEEPLNAFRAELEKPS